MTKREKTKQSIKEDMATLQKTHGTDSLYQRMTGIKKSGKKGDAQKNGEDIYKIEEWDDNPEMEAGIEQKQKFEKEKVYATMLANENRKKKFALGKWGRKPNK